MQAEEQALTTLERIAGERAQEGVAAEAREARAALAGRRFNVAVMGQFKRGKSTLINALLGRELLPADVAPVTTAVTVVECGPRESAAVRFVDGHEEEIGVDQLRLFVSEENNPGNRKGVRVARIELPCPLLASGMRLVDTPGVGSVFENNGEATREFVPRIDVAVVVLGSDPPITGDELALVKSVAPGVGRIFFVLNKADIVAEPVRVKAEAFTRRVLRDALGDDPGRLIHASALTALGGGLDPGVAALTRDLSELAARAGTELARTSGARAARHLVARVLGALDIERAALLSPTDEIDRRIAAFLDAMRDIDDLALAALARTKAALSYDWSAWEEEKETFLVEARRALRASVESELARLDGASRRKMRNQAREHARAAGERQVAIWHERAAAEMQRRRESWTAQASERANALIDRVAHAAAAAFDIPVARFEPEVLDLDAPPPVFEFFEDVIFLDPRAVVVALSDTLSFRRAVARRAAARAAAAADGWLQRNLYDVDQTLVGWLDKLATGLDAALRARLDAARQEVLDAVAAGRRRRERGEMAVKERMEELDRQRADLLEALAPLSVA
ncbi:MAG: hypothetical protein B7Z61_04030 [Acidobacteria bacterium 37-71-11]|nr:MAG: hypothetical protein B7Z61_04030 [Acidobacteria bacterium 37-71-11]HQT94511.1 dynamin family protein [Thermoanaerobaculaceae bacterium]